jgi:SAM-dependent methyltransferase
MLRRSHAPPVPLGGRLAALFFEHDGHVSDKWEQYLAIYEVELQRFIARASPVRMLEIGVQNGGSLELWAKYLPAGSSIVGMDIDEKCADIPFGDNVRVVIGDASDRAVLDRLLGDQRFDVIVDDGSHRSQDVIATFCACFPRLEPGGIYIVEDLHCSYFASHGGGLRKPDTSIEWFKSLVDGLNTDHFRGDAGVISSEEMTRLEKLNRDIVRIAFYDSLAVVEKLARPKAEPYRRVMTGESGSVADLFLTLSHLTTLGLNNVVLRQSTTDALMPMLLQALASAREDVGALRVTLDSAASAAAALRTRAETAEVRAGSAEAEVVALRARADSAKTEAAALLARAGSAEAALAVMNQSTFWRLTWPLRTIVRRLPAPIRRVGRGVLNSRRRGK